MDETERERQAAVVTALVNVPPARVADLAVQFVRGIDG
jgi:hypothetical protein